MVVNVISVANLKVSKKGRKQLKIKFITYLVRMTDTWMVLMSLRIMPTVLTT